MPLDFSKLKKHKLYQEGNTYTPKNTENKNILNNNNMQKVQLATVNRTDNNEIAQRVKARYENIMAQTTNTMQNPQNNVSKININQQMNANTGTGIRSTAKTSNANAGKLPNTKVNEQQINQGKLPTVEDINNKKNSSPKKYEENKNANNEKKWYQKILQKPEILKDNLRHFEDGYQFGDITKTYKETKDDLIKVGAGTIADLGLGFTKGVAGIGEGVGKAISGGIAQVADWTGHDEYAKKVRNRLAGREEGAFDEKYLPTNLISTAQKKVDKASISGEYGDKISENAGYMAGLMATETIAPGASTATMFLNATGNSLAEVYAKDENVEDWQAWTKAIGSGTIETVVEKSSGLLGGKGIGEKVSGKIAKQISSGAGKSLSKLLGVASDEAIEEFKSYIGNYGLDRFIDSVSKVTGSDIKFSEDWNWNEVGEAMGLAFATSFVMGGSNVQVDMKSEKSLARNELIDSSNLGENSKAQPKRLSEKNNWTVENLKNMLEQGGNLNNENNATNLTNKGMNNEVLQDNQQITQLENKMVQNGNMEQNKQKQDNIVSVVDTDYGKNIIHKNALGKDESVYFRFDDKGGFKGQNHKSGVSMWEDRVDDYIYNTENESEIKEKYGIEDVFELEDSKLEELKREIVEDNGWITDGASVFDLSEEGIDFFKKYDRNHHISDYIELNVFTGKKNGEGADGENVVIPNKVLATIDTEKFLDIIDDIEYNDKFESATDEEKNRELIHRVADFINKENKFKDALANNQETLYNNTESEGDNNGLRREGMGESEKITRIIEDKENQYTAEGFRQAEQKAKERQTKNITTKQSEIKNKYENQINKEIRFFDGTENDIPAFASEQEKNVIYINSKTFENYDYNKVIYHETLESEITHNDEINDISKETAREIIKDNNFNNQINEFFKDSETTTDNPYAIAKDIICDMYAKYVTGEELDYKNVLDLETNTIINDSLEKIDNIINNTKNSNESSFSLPPEKSILPPEQTIPLKMEKEEAVLKINLDDNTQLPKSEKVKLSKQDVSVFDEDLQAIKKASEKGLGEIITVDEQLEAIQNLDTKELDNRLPDTSNMIVNKLKREKTSFKEFTTMIRKLVTNKGAGVDDLFKATGNKQGTWKYDRYLGSFSEGQTSIGVNQVDTQGQTIGDSLLTIYDKAKKDGITQKILDDYVLNKDNIARSNYEKGLYGESITSKDSQKIIAEYDKKYPQLKDYAKQVSDFGNHNTESYLVGTFISQDLYDHMRAMYPDHVPVVRDISDTPGMSEYDNVGTQILKSAKGGDEAILSPKEALAQQSVAYAKAYRRNEALKEVYKSIKSDTKVLYDLGQIVDIEQANAEIQNAVGYDENLKKYTATIFENGEAKVFEISKDIYDAFTPSEAMTKFEDTIDKLMIGKVLKKASSGFKSLTTGKNILYALKNMVRDINDAPINSTTNFANYMKDWGYAYEQIVTNGKYYKEYINSGRFGKYIL